MADLTNCVESVGCLPERPRQEPASQPMRRSLRIACIGARGIPSNYSGIERACESLYTELANRGHEVTVYCRQEYVSRRRQYYGDIRILSAPAIRTRSLDTLSHVGASLIQAIARERYDVIHLHALAPNVFARLCRVSRVPTVATVHGLDWKRAKWKGLGAKILQFAEASMVRNVDQIIVVSRELQQYYAQRYGRETVCIPNGVKPLNGVDCTNATVLQEFGLTSRGYVLYLGRLVPEKRVEDLILAYRGIKSPLRVVITGESGFTDTYVASLRRLAAPDARIVFTGLQKGQAVHDLLHHAAAFVSPSALEGLPMSVLECMQHGTPSVLSDIPPHRELLGSVAGYDLFFPPANVNALRTKIETALAAQGEYRRIAAGARILASKMPSWPAIAQRTETVYYEAVDHFASHPNHWSHTRALKSGMSRNCRTTALSLNELGEHSS